MNQRACNLSTANSAKAFCKATVQPCKIHSVTKSKSAPKATKTRLAEATSSSEATNPKVTSKARHLFPCPARLKHKRPPHLGWEARILDKTCEVRARTNSNPQTQKLRPGCSRRSGPYVVWLSGRSPRASSAKEAWAAGPRSTLGAHPPKSKERSARSMSGPPKSGALPPNVGSTCCTSGCVKSTRFEQKKDANAGSDFVPCAGN